MSDLKPCPFCGGEAKTEQVERIHYGTVYRVGCNTVGCRGWWYESVLYRTEAKAIEAWNTRADDNEEVVTCSNCGAQIDMLGMFTPLAKSSVLYRHYATYCPACGERLEQ